MPVMSWYLCHFFFFKDCSIFFKWEENTRVLQRITSEFWLLACSRTRLARLKGLAGSRRRGGAGCLPQQGAGPHRRSFWTWLQINPPLPSFTAREPKNLRGVHKILVLQGNKRQKPQGIFTGMRTSMSSRGPNVGCVLSTSRCRLKAILVICW